jgi:hypothetical protein
MWHVERNETATGQLEVLSRVRAGQYMVVSIANANYGKGGSLLLT